MTRNSRGDVIRAAGRLFAEKGYHGTSMRDLGEELGLRKGSLYAHIASKQELLVEVVERGASLFQASADTAAAVDGGAVDRLRAFVAGHVDVVLDNVDEARTFLNEARSLEPEYRARIVTARDRYEVVLRGILAAGVEDGTLSPTTDPKLSGIFVLSVLNAVDLWFHEPGPLDRSQLVESILTYALDGVR